MRSRLWLAAAFGSAVALAVGVLSVSGSETAAVVTAAAQDVPAPPGGWATVFSDDFTGAAGSGLNRANWLYDTGTGYPGGAGNWGTGEIETTTDSAANVYQDGNGHLVIKPVRDASGHWTSGRVETQRTDFAAPAGGEMEMTASIEQPNPANGLGYWPAFWALGAAARPAGATNWPGIGELDTMEDVNGLSEVAHTFHCGVDPGGPCHETSGLGSGLLACGGCQTGYHTYSVIVDRRNTAAEQLRFYTDGAPRYTVNENQVDATTWKNAVDHGFLMILNVAIGGGFPNGVCGCSAPSAATSSGAGMTVDYVAVYQTGAGAPTTTRPAPTTTRPPVTTTTTTTATSVAAPPGGGSASAFHPIAVAHLARAANGARVAVPRVDFGSGATQFYGHVASGAGTGISGLVEVRLDSPAAAPVGSFAVASTGGWTSWRVVPANMAKVTGVHPVYLTFTSGQPAPFVSLDWFDFGN